MVKSFEEFQAVSKDSKLSVLSILVAFGAEPEHDKYGIANAVTRAAQGEENWEKSVELERIRGKVVTLATEELKKWDE